jgi:ceramide glucosyltransferase
VAINADFWSQVLQSRSLKPLDFALGAVMATTRGRLEAIGGFRSLVDFLADDYQLGNLIARRAGRIFLCPVVVECRESPRKWSEVWRHQLRWARTIRVCQPLPYFFSILGNATLWPLLGAQFGAARPFLEWNWAHEASVHMGNVTATSQGIEIIMHWTFPLLLVCLMVRLVSAFHLQARLNQSVRHWFYFWLVPLKDLLNVLIWALAFLGNTVEWRGQHYRVRGGGRLEKIS